MPGGKIVVNEGILPYTQDNAGLAIVLGHEVAHAVANHSSERISQQVLANAGGQVLGVLLQNSSAVSQNVAQQVYGLGAQYGVMLPYSRSNESEADHLGLIFAARPVIIRRLRLVSGSGWLRPAEVRSLNS